MSSKRHPPEKDLEARSAEFIDYAEGPLVTKANIA